MQAMKMTDQITGHENAGCLLLYKQQPRCSQHYISSTVDSIHSTRRRNIYDSARVTPNAHLAIGCQCVICDCFQRPTTDILAVLTALIHLINNITNGLYGVTTSNPFLKTKLALRQFNSKCLPRDTLNASAVYVMSTLSVCLSVCLSHS